MSVWQFFSQIWGVLVSHLLLFLLQVLHYARQRIPTLNEFCVVCDEPHVFQNGAMLKVSPYYSS